MKYYVKMGSGTLIFISSFVKICSGIQQLLEGGGLFTYRRRHTESKMVSQALLSFQNEESRLNGKYCGLW
jgi:hypothetical protein